MIEVLIWGVTTALITVGAGGAIAMVERRRRRQAAELELIEEVAERVEAMDDLEARLAGLDARVAATTRRLHRGNEE